MNFLVLRAWIFCNKKKNYPSVSRGDWPAEIFCSWIISYLKIIRVVEIMKIHIKYYTLYAAWNKILQIKMKSNDERSSETHRWKKKKGWSTFEVHKNFLLVISWIKTSHQSRKFHKQVNMVDEAAVAPVIEHIYVPSLQRVKCEKETPSIRPCPKIAVRVRSISVLVASSSLRSPITRLLHCQLFHRALARLNFREHTMFQ